jgi:hypothetical protein
MTQVFFPTGVPCAAPPNPWLDTLNRQAFPNGILLTSLIGTVNDLLDAPPFGIFSSVYPGVCTLGTDCVSESCSQDLTGLGSNKPAVVTATNKSRPHFDFPAKYGGFSGESEDFTGILFAIRRLP